eukprot:5087353-Prymnesium_polylepis.1
MSQVLRHVNTSLRSCSHTLTLDIPGYPWISIYMDIHGYPWIENGWISTGLAFERSHTILGLRE